MANISLEKVDGYVQEKLKDKEFRRFYELERMKLALAKKIMEMRRERKLNQKDLASRLGVSQQFISQIETGEEQNLTMDTLIRIAGSLGHNIRISFPKNFGRGVHLEVA